VKENNPLERFKIASKMFIVLLKQKYQDKEVSSNELMNDPDLQIFINILMKHKTRLKGETKVTDEYYLMLQELELNILKNFRSDAIDSLNLNNSSGQVLVYVFYKKMLEGYPDLKPEDINYQEFYVNGFHGILVNVQGIEYILSSDLLEQNVQGAMMQNMDEPEMASVKYASLYTVGYGNITIMKKDNKWYDYNGDILHFSETHSLISDKDKDKTLDNNINRSRLLSTDTGFISIINLLTLIVMAISITIWIYLKIG